MSIVSKPPRGGWCEKFACAGRGVRLGLRTQTSFVVHLLVAAAVVLMGVLLECQFTDWCLLVLCITGVLTAEMFNTAIESLAKAITSNHDPHIGDALDLGSAAVLFGAIGSSGVGLAIFVLRVLARFYW